ncbi:MULTISPECIES: lysozyme inhibitor LprI family protein [Clostridia]|jgi:uncharacterized protein YecT (DUF1311 family)|uniref:lysozyme inhibitor LprI family protein n=1 Tax=Clostridia TaxID=186801 RepID=UPI0018ABD74E|nr:lysozyme inhibitor LprI family protein [Clostridium sp. 1001270J_160509_D11]
MIVAVIIILSALALALFFLKKSKITAIAFSVVLLVIGIVFIKEGQDLNQEQQSQNKVASQSKSEKSDNSNNDKSSDKTDNQENNKSTKSSNQANSTKTYTSNNNLVGLKSKYLAQLDELTVQTDERQQIDDIPWIEVRRIAAESYQMWDDKLNEIYGVLKQELPADEMAALKQEEIQWINERDSAVKQVEIQNGPGTFAPYEMSMTKLSMTRDRCYELVNSYFK